MLIPPFLTPIALICIASTVDSCENKNAKRNSSPEIDTVSFRKSQTTKTLQASIDSITPCRIFETNICVSIDIRDKGRRDAILSSIASKLRENNSTTNYTVLIYNTPAIIDKLKQTQENYPFASEDYKVELTNYEGRSMAGHFTLSDYYLFLGEDANAVCTATLDTLLMKRFPDLNFTTNRFTYLFPHQQNFETLYFELITGTDSALSPHYGNRIFGFYEPKTALVTVLKIETETMTEGIERDVPAGYR